MRALFLAVRSAPPGSELTTFVKVAERDPADFRSIPQSPFAYWASDAVFEIFSHGESLEGGDRQARIGMTTHDDERWLRLWWEVSDPALRPLAKGGEYGRFYRDLPLGVLWNNEGRNLIVSKRERFRLGELTENNSKLWNRSHYGRPGLTWTRRSQAGFSLRALPRGAFFGDKGPALVGSVEKQGHDLQPYLAVGNSSAFRYLLELQVAFGSYETGALRRTPVPRIQADVSDELALLAGRSWSLRRSLDTCIDVSHAFVLPAILQVVGISLEDRIAAWTDRVIGVSAELAAIQSEIDECCLDLYELCDEDRHAITEGFTLSDGDDGGEVDADDDQSEAVGPDPVGLAAGLVSWAVGVVVGRFDVRLATGLREWPLEPDLFDPLPVCSPAMLTGDEGLPLAETPARYPIEISPVLVDDPGHPLDLTAGVRSVFDLVFGDDADAWWSDVGEALGARNREVGAWLSKGYFDHHLKTHSKSRRKAPILWPLGTKSGSYTVWLYAHRATTDSLFQVLNDIVDPKLAVEQRQLVELTQEAGPNPSSTQRKTIDTQERFVDELRELRDELEAVAPLWAPDLNDGVVIVLAPLWKLFAHHRAWSKELKGHWDKLAAGHYDWAQLAMHLWPDRVILKCAEDRSLAIAHHLEDEFWVQDPDNPDKWHPRTTPTTPIDQLITHHTVLPPGSPAT